MEIRWFHHLFVAFLAIGIPLWDYFGTKKARAATDVNARELEYWKTIAWLWVATAFLVLTTPNASLFYPPHGPELHWLQNVVPAPGSIAKGLLVGASLLLIVGTIMPLFSHKFRLQTAKALEMMRFYLPVNTRQRLVFALVAISAGICEEVIYRGFLASYITSMGLNLWWAVAIGCLLFALAHGYQGVGGAIQVAFIGAFVFALFLLSGSLLLPIIAHLIMDLRILLFPSDVMTGAVFQQVFDDAVDENPTAVE